MHNIQYPLSIIVSFPWDSYISRYNIFPQHFCAQNVILNISWNISFSNNKIMNTKNVFCTSTSNLHILQQYTIVIAIVLVELLKKKMPSKEFFPSFFHCYIQFLTHPYSSFTIFLSQLFWIFRLNFFDLIIYMYVSVMVPECNRDKN